MPVPMSQPLCCHLPALTLPHKTAETSFPLAGSSPAQMTHALDCLSFSGDRGY